jgi:cation diffusion facilitator CzcD-associated flavoprotein CzcO
MGIQLKRAGWEAFTIFERSRRVGGTWHDNRYPGAGCDVPSHLYCFSFEPNPDWSRKYSEQPEIHRYLEHCATKYGLLDHVRFDTEIASARFDETARLWRLRTAAGEEIVASVIVSGVGQLNRPYLPELPGLERFSGASFHSARWNAEHDLAERDVAVIGNGASAIQLIPRIAGTARTVRVFQRSPNWLLPRNDRAYSARERWAFRHLPLYRRLYRDAIYCGLEARFSGLLRDSWVSKQVERIALGYLEAEVADPRLRRALTPDYPVGCKRILISDDYYRALSRPNVELVTAAIERIGERAIVTRDGASRAVDTIVLATGFETTTFLAPMELAGAGGQRLAEVWQRGAEAYLGMSVAGFPNLFLLYGPNTNLGHNSIIFMIECQVDHVMRCLAELARTGSSDVDVRPEAMARESAAVQHALERTAWAGDCRSWYKTASGRITNNWPGLTTQYWWRTRRLARSDYRWRPG